MTNGISSASGSASTNGDQVSPGALSIDSDNKATLDDFALDNKVVSSILYGSLSDDATIDGDTTIISDTSTIRGDSSDHGPSAIYMDKCAQLERTVESLKNKLINKEKELTDLQLKLWSSDYQTDQLKVTISRLEKENAQLKSAVLKSGIRIS